MSWYSDDKHEILAMIYNVNELWVLECNKNKMDRLNYGLGVNATKCMFRCSNLLNVIINL